MLRRVGVILVCVTCGLVFGCAEDSGPKEPSLSRRADDALKDPFGYKPTVDTDITGGGTGHYDNEAMRRDVDHVLNP